MKPMPASCTQRPTWSGERSILTPSAAKTSAAPERDDSARLPCLATGTPTPATMKAAQVDTLTEPEPSPPVPTTSTASAGASTRSILARIAVTAPVISSTVSPRTRSAINNPPICEGVASPDIMLSNADAASSRDRVAPVATLPMIDLRSCITCFQQPPVFPSLFISSIVVGAGHLRKRRLVERRADVLLQTAYILRDLFLGQSAQQRLFQFLDFVGGKIHRRNADLGDAKHDPLAATVAGGLSDAVLGGPEGRGDGACRHAGQRCLAFEGGGGFELDADAGRFLGELAALVELLHHV